MPQPKTSTKGLRCDVCEKKDGMHGFTLVTCSTCNVSVHTSCYGLAPTTKNDQWECHACRSIEPNEKGIKTLNKRPYQCKLCSVKNGTHAMHPLFDTHGKKGKKIGWVHTLCALAIGANSITKGAVYGCDENGTYEGDDVESAVLSPEHEFDDNSSLSSDEDIKALSPKSSKKQHPPESPASNSNNEPEFSETHHFVICPTNDKSVWANVVRDSRALKCIICNLRDGKNGILRIPIQCEAGGEEEAPELLNRRKRTRKETCYLAMHVGCARWRNDKPYQRVFFFPGMSQFDNGEETIVQPRCCVYCNTHAKDIYDHPKSGVVKPTTSATTFVSQQGKKNGLQGFNALPAALSKAQQEKKHGLQGFNAVLDQPSKRKSNTSLESASDLKRNKFNSPPSSPPIPPSSKSKAEIFPQVLDYVLTKIKTCTKGKEVEATRQAKEYWKQKSKLPSNEFKDLWNKIKETVSKKVKKEKELSNSNISIDSSLRKELRRSSSITSIDSSFLKDLKRSSSITSIDSTIRKELSRSNSITSIDSTTKKELGRSNSMWNAESATLDEIVTTTTEHADDNKKQHQIVEMSDDPWISLWMPDYDRNSESFRLLLE